MLPDGQNFESSAGDKERDWKMNDNGMLSMSGEQRRLQIKRIRGSRTGEKYFHVGLRIPRRYFSTTIVPVILGWTEQK